MKKLILSLGAVAFFGILVAFAADAGVKSVKRGPVNHMVAFKFKTEATAAQIKEVEGAFKALKTKIPQIVSLDWGTNVSPEKLNKEFTHGWHLTFKSEADRDAYLVHPDHKAFGNLVGGVLADVFVLDFVSKD